MPSKSEPVYGRSTGRQSERPRLHLFPLIVSWLATGIAFMVAAGILPGAEVRRVQDEGTRLGAADPAVPPGPILGAASVHGILSGWRSLLQAGVPDDAAAASAGNGSARRDASRP